MNLETLVLDQFEGVNFKNPADELDPSETPLAKNVAIVGDGEGIAMRRGSINVGKTGDTGWPAWPSAVSRMTNLKIWEEASGFFLPVVSLNGDIYVKASIPLHTLDLRYDNPSTSHSWSFEPADDSGGISRLWCLGQDSSTAATPKKMDIAAVVTDWLGTPPRGRTLKYWRGRMVIGGVISAANNERIYFSDIGNPESWPVNNFVDLRTSSDLADPVMRLEVLGEDLYVFRKYSVWRITDPTAFTNERVFDIGVANKYATCVLEGRIYWVSFRGVYSTDGADLVCETENLDGRDPLSGTPNFFDNGGHANFNEAHKIVASAKGHILWSLGNELLLEGYPELKGDGGMPWMIHTMPGVDHISVIATMPFQYTDNSQVMFGGDAGTTNFLGTWDDLPYSDYDYVAGANRKIVTEYWTPWISVDDIDEFTRIRKISMLLGSLSGVGLELKMDIYVDWDLTAPVATNSINTAGSVDRDVMNYWRPEARCRAFAVKFYTEAGVTSFKDWELDRIQVSHRGRVANGN